MAQKDAIVVCLDVGQSMWDPETQGESRSTTKLQEAQSALSMYLQQKVMDGRKTEKIGLVLFGFDKTDNPLNYKNVWIQSKIQHATVEMIQFVEEDIIPGQSSCDWIDALIVAMDMLETQPPLESWKTYSRRIIIISDVASKSNDENSDIIINELNNKNVTLQIFGLDFEDPELKIKGMPYKTVEKTQNEALLKEWSKKVNDLQIIPMTEALERLSYFRSRAIRQTSVFRGTLDIAGDSLRIPVWMYTKAKSTSPPSFKRIHIENDKPVEVERETSYQRVDDSEPVDREDLVKCYKYGKTFVPFAKVDEEQLAMRSEKGLQLIGFAKAEHVPINLLLGNTLEVDPQPNDPVAARALSALIHAMFELQRVGIVRYVRTNGKGGPQLGVLTPHIGLNRECFYYTKLPFAEDYRNYSFASLAKHKVSNEQQSAMDNFVDSLDLMTAAKDVDEEPMEDLKPSNTPNVTIHRIQEAIKARAIKPERPLPARQPALDRIFERNRPLWRKATAAVSKLDSSFKLERTEAAVKAAERKEVQQQWKQVSDQPEDAQPDAKRIKLEDDEDMSITMLNEQSVTSVGSMDPVGDFRKMVNQRNVDRVVDAMTQLAKVVVSLVTTSFGDQNFSKALECISEFRKVAIAEEESDRFNDFLASIKDSFIGRPGSGHFWEMVQDRRLTLITSDEADDSRVSRSAADEFIRKDAAPSIRTEPKHETTAEEDLLDELE